MPTLRSRSDFARIETEGRARADRLLVLRYAPNDLDHDRFGISTGRRVGGAVQRNRVRRRIREVLRHSIAPQGSGLDVLIVARPPSATATFDELRSVLERLLRAMRSGEVRDGS